LLGLDKVLKMMKFIFLLIVLFGAWNWYSKHQVNKPIDSASMQIEPDTLKPSPVMPPAPSYRCDGRIHCSQMSSCEEATFFLKSCSGTKMDGDHDGIPCEEQLCGH
jgi:hypothetical protein